MTRLLAAFQQFFREHSESRLERFDYRRPDRSCCCRPSCSASMLFGTHIAYTASIALVS